MNPSPQQSNVAGAEPLRILVMGTGAVGSVIGGLLAKSGEKTTFVGREPHMRACRERGLKIEGLFGDHHATLSDCHTSVGAIAGREFDVILLTVKTFDTASALDQVMPLVGPHTILMSLQNGLGNVEQVEQRVGAERAAAGRVIFGAEVPQPGHAVVTVCADDMRLGVVRKESAGLTARVADLVRRFQRAGVPAQFTDDLHGHLWAKLLYNAALNPLGTILQCTYGYLLENESTREQMRCIVAECFEVAGAMGVELFWPDATSYIPELFDKLIPATERHFPSMYRDITRGRPTEIKAMNGYIVREGRERGIATPTNALVTEMIHCLERRDAVMKEKGWIE